MSPEHQIHGQNEDEVWQQVEAHLTQNEVPLQFGAVIQQQGKAVLLDIDIDLGGGFESGISFTTFRAPLHSSDGFRFALHREHFTDEIGKFFGMQDIKIGYPDFDRRIVVKSNDESRVRALFADDVLREALVSLPDFCFGIISSSTPKTGTDTDFLELSIDEGILDPMRLRSLYHVFFQILCALDQPM
jgi:hypothetical protein